MSAVQGTAFIFSPSVSPLLMTRSCGKARIDYKVLHSTGERVLKACGTVSQVDMSTNRCSKMSDLDKLKTLESRNRDDVDELIEWNSPEEFHDVDRIDSHLKCLMDLWKETKETYKQLFDLGVEEYRSAYNSVSSKVKAEYKKFQELRSSAQTKIRDDIDLCVCRIDCIINGYPVETLSSVDDIRLNIDKVNDHLATYNYLISRFTQKDKSGAEYPLVLARAVDYVKEGRSKLNYVLSRVNGVRFQLLNRCSKMSELVRLRRLEDWNRIDIDDEIEFSHSPEDFDDLSRIDRHV